jgi:ribulose-5-phosphate 4-epimerase/fuculose-1-phosphate aldolase
MSKKLDEGVIKFKYTLKMGPPIEENLYIELEKWRALLFKMNLIGEYPIEKIGYGNLSRRISLLDNQFIISGTQTGKYPHLSGHQYTKVVKCHLQKMNVEAVGPIAPSSESLTHFAIYSSCQQINAILHVHNFDLWQYMINEKMDATNESVSYGTIEIADEAKRCIGNNKAGIFVMKGHQDGVIAYGNTIEEAGKILLDTFKNCRK